MRWATQFSLHINSGEAQSKKHPECASTLNHHVDQLTLTEKAHDSLGALANNVRGGEGDRCLVQQQRLQASLYLCFSTFLFYLSFEFVFVFVFASVFPLTLGPPTLSESFSALDCSSSPEFSGWSGWRGPLERPRK